MRFPVMLYIVMWQLHVVIFMLLRFSVLKGSNQATAHTLIAGVGFRPLLACLVIGCIEHRSI